LMLGARLVEGLDLGLLGHAREALPTGALDACLEGLLMDGLLSERDGRLAPTESGWLLGNELYERLWDLAPGKVASVDCGA
ncbi:MAG: coproporphyrinogen dehydrogenase, partial [Paratractidigestivibacter faecalis]